CCLRKLTCCRNRPWLKSRIRGLLARDGCRAKHHLRKRGLFAYVSFSDRLAKKYVPFVCRTPARRTLAVCARFRPCRVPIPALCQMMSDAMGSGLILPSLRLVASDSRECLHLLPGRVDRRSTTGDMAAVPHIDDRYPR